MFVKSTVKSVDGLFDSLNIFNLTSARHDQKRLKYCGYAQVMENIVNVKKQWEEVDDKPRGARFRWCIHVSENKD